LQIIGGIVLFSKSERWKICSIGPGVPADRIDLETFLIVPSCPLR
jgi:hypothetical protein